MRHPAGPAMCPYLKKVYFIPSEDKSKSARFSCAAQPCSEQCVCDPLTLCSLFSSDGSPGSTGTNARYNAGTLERKARLWCWHSGGSRCSLLCLCWAKLYTQFLKKHSDFCEVLLYSCRTEEPSATSYQGLHWRTSTRRASDGDACPRSSFRSFHSQLTRNWLLINCVDLYFWARSNFTWAKRPC